MAKKKKETTPQLTAIISTQSLFESIIKQRLQGVCPLWGDLSATDGNSRCCGCSESFSKIEKGDFEVVCCFVAFTTGSLLEKL